VNVLYWANMAFAESQLTTALLALPVHLTIAHSFEEVQAALPDCDMVVAADCPEEHARDFAKQLAESPVRWFQFLSAGRDRLTRARLPPAIELFGPGEALAPAVAEHAFALALSLYRGIPQAVNSGSWDRKVVAHMRALEGDTALVVGLGAIGCDVARRAKAFGMRVLAATRTPRDDANCDSVRPLDALADLLPEAGVVFLTLALTPETRHTFGAVQFAAMRKGAFMINVGRGGLLDQAALAAALSSGMLGGAGLDVADPEPLADDDPLWQAPNLVITPHVAAIGSWRSEQRLAALVADKVGDIERGMRIRAP
jgi:phosphoglycerate dehydrogenase-like enzyme